MHGPAEGIWSCGLSARARVVRGTSMGGAPAVQFAQFADGRADLAGSATGPGLRCLSAWKRAHGRSLISPTPPPRVITNVGTHATLPIKFANNNMQATSTCIKCATRHYASQACPPAPPAKIEESLGRFVEDAWLLRIRMRATGRALTAARLAALMRRDEPHATADYGFTRSDYARLLAQAGIIDADNAFYDEFPSGQEVSAASQKIRYRLYINAVPARAATIFRNIWRAPYRPPIDGLLQFKIAGSGSWKGRRDLIVAYFVDAETAIKAAKALVEYLSNQEGWPGKWVRSDTLPGTFRVAEGFGVAWDPQHLFVRDEFNACYYYELCFGTTHTQRYSELVRQFFRQLAASPADSNIKIKFAAWVKSYANPLKPYNPPPRVLLEEGFDERELD